MVATALSVAPVTYLLRPGTAYAAICSCSGQSCDCGSTCCDGYTEFCCSLYGVNACPAGTIPAGWWKADGSGVCDATAGPQPRYYLDCNVADCGSCGCGGSGTCSGGCASPRDYFCGCGNGNCGLRKAGCTQFRYGQCNQGVKCVGPIACRVVTCTPPWVWDASCTTTSATDNNTRFHNAPCLNQEGAWPAGAPLVGDWTGSGRDMPGVFANGRWYLKRADGGPDIVFDFGAASDRPVVGDWNGNGVDNPGVVRDGQWFLRDSNSTGSADRSFWFGNPGDLPFAGDWTGDGIDKPGLYRRSDGFVYLRNSLTQGIADISFYFGNPGDLPLAGDFNGSGRDSVSLYRPSEQRFYIISRLGSNNGGLGAADFSYTFGNPGDRPLVGDWDGNGIDGPGVYRNRAWYLRNDNSTGPHIRLTMTAILVIEGLAILVLGLLVVGLLRSNAEITRSLHQLGVSDHEGSVSGAPRPVPRLTTAGAEDIMGQSLQGSTVQVGVTGHEGQTLLAFLSTGCSACIGLWEGLQDNGRPITVGGARLVVVTKGAEAESPSRLSQLAPTGVTLVQSSEAWETYGVPVSPYFVLVDGPKGAIVGEGSATSWEQVRSLLGQALADASMNRTDRMPNGELRADAELRKAGIGPGHPSLYPDGPPISE